MIRHRFSRRARGAAMLGVLIVLLLITIMASGFFMQARDSSSLHVIAVTQAIALSNAEMGMQEAIRRIRAAQVRPVEVATCTDAEVDAGLCLATYTVGPINGPTTDPANGGGVLYQFIIYRRGLPPPAQDLVMPPNRYVVRVTGFYGENVTSVNLVTSVLEAEVDMGVGFRTSCVGGYECS